jgi:DNA-binding transcriptional ArsR family regulator
MSECDTSRTRIKRKNFIVSLFRNMETFIYWGLYDKDMPDEKLARALGSRIRRDILHSLIKKELSVHQIAEHFDLSEVNASKHLKKLYDLGLLNTKTRGRERFYSIKIPEIKFLIREYDKVAAKIGGLNNVR